MSKPTPGPYFVDRSPSAQSPDLYLFAEYAPEERSQYPESDGKWLGIVRRYHNADEQAATAVLLAAAPDLLDACRDALVEMLVVRHAGQCRCSVEFVCTPCDVIASLGAAIRKAEGMP